MDPLIKLASLENLYSQKIMTIYLKKWKKLFSKNHFYHCLTDQSNYTSILMQVVQLLLVLKKEMATFYQLAILANLSPSEKHHPALKLELMLIVKSINTLKFFLYNWHFTILRDSKALEYYKCTTFAWLFVTFGKINIFRDFFPPWLIGEFWYFFWWSTAEFRVFFICDRLMNFKIFSFYRLVKMAGFFPGTGRQISVFFPRNWLKNFLNFFHDSLTTIVIFSCDQTMNLVIFFSATN